MKSNKQFMILSAIGIVMVVDLHAGTSLELGTAYFPYNSFFMPMFMFISGYFISHKRCIEEPVEYMYRKVKRILLPYLGWSLYYATFINILRLFTPVRVGFELSVVEYIKGIFLCGEIFDINAPGYFAIILFYVTIIMIALRRILGKFWNDYLITVVFIALGCFVVRYSLMNSHNFATATVFNMAMKVVISLQFFQLGTLYKNKLEKYVSKINLVVIIICFFGIIRIVQHNLGNIRWSLNRLVFNQQLSDVRFHMGYFIPFLTSLMGIILWVKIAEFLVPVLGDNKLCNYISDHTFGIMMHHITFMSILNWILVGINRIKAIPGLDIDAIKTSSWYRFVWGETADFKFFYFLIGIIGSCLFCYLVDRIKKYARKISTLRNDKS